MTADRLREVADRYESLVRDLERARDHARTAARHFHEGEVPRGCAHAFAIEGHVRKVMAQLEALSILHAERSDPSPADD